MASSMASMVAAIHTTTAPESTSSAYSSQQQQQGGQQLAVTSQQQATGASNASLVETGDSAQEEIKSEFYTREGLWRLVSNSGEYARQLIASQQQQFVQPSQQQQQQSTLPSSSQSTATLGVTSSYQTNTNTTTTGLGVTTQLNGSSSVNLNGSPVVVNVSQVQTTTSTPNEPVQAKLIRFSKKLLVQSSFLNELENVPNLRTASIESTLARLCKKCWNATQSTSTKTTTNKKLSIGGGGGGDYDDDDDVVFTKLTAGGAGGGVKFTLNDSSSVVGGGGGACARCGSTSSDLLDVFESILNDDDSDTKISIPHLDVLVFNYSKEIYTYEFNDLLGSNETTSTSESERRRCQSSESGTGTVPGSSSSKNLIDKKVYKTYMSSCLDVNRMASALNTKALQLVFNASLQSSVNTVVQQPPSIIMSPQTAGTTTSYQSQQTPTSKTTTTTTAASLLASTSPRDILQENFKFSLSPTNLSLIVAAGFAKGEIHVFDVFKKDASVFYNSSKLVDKSKVTCIKWLPNSVNLFLAGYSSGNIYLYDANIQSQATVAPSYSKYIHTEAYSVFFNTSSSSDQSSSSSAQVPSSSSGSSSQAGVRTVSNATGTNLASSVATASQQQSSSVLLNNTQQKLLQLNLSNLTQPVQVAKNPLVRIKIGECPSHILQQIQQLQPAEASSDLSGVNEMAFSPCGQYLAVVSQDGYLRIFFFVYDTTTTSTTSTTTLSPLQIQLKCSMKSYFGGLLCVCWSHDGRYVATGGEDDLITVFEFAPAVGGDRMRVACRGRGHSSWINAVAFDPWTLLPNYGSAPPPPHSTSDVFGTNHRKDDSNISDADDQSTTTTTVTVTSKEHNQTTKTSTNKQQEIEQQLDEQEEANRYKRDQKITGPKQRTISTLSDYNNLNVTSSSSPRRHNHQHHHHHHRVVQQQASVSAESNPFAYYRLASVGQDNQICFWDLTEDVLKERPGQVTSAGAAGLASSSSSQRTRVSSITASTSTTTASTITSSSSSKPSNGGSSVKTHHHSTASSLVSTARSLFSKHSDKAAASNANKYPGEFSTDGEDTNSTTTIIKNSSLSSGLFRKNKRNSNGGGDQPQQPSSVGKSSSKLVGKSGVGSQAGIILNSYKKSTHAFGNSSSHDSNNTLTTEAAENANNSTMSKKGSTARLTQSLHMVPVMQDYGQFNQCPKLDEVALIEPLICKRIANERLTSLQFRHDCFVVATQDGFVYTWSRPIKESGSKAVAKSILNDTKITTSL